MLANDFEGALAASDKALELNEGSARNWITRALCLKQLGRAEEAIAAFDRALAVRPDMSTIWADRGWVQFELGRYSEALVSLDRSVAISPELAKLWVMRGIALHRLGREREAVESYDRALTISPTYGEALAKRGVSLQNLGRFADALESYRRAVEANPQEKAVWADLGVLLLRHPGLRPESIPSAQHCLNREALLLGDADRADILRKLIEAIENYCDAPLLARGLIDRFGIVPRRLGEESRWLALERDTELPTALLAWLDEASTPLSQPDRLRLRGQVYLTFGDPVRAIPTLSELLRESPGDLTGMAFLMWAMLDCLEPAGNLFYNCRHRAEQVIADPGAGATDLYYAGHLFRLVNESERAVEAFKRAGPWPPAQLMLWHWADGAGQATVADAALEGVLDAELRWFEAGLPRSLLYPQALGHIDPRTDDGRDGLQWAIHAFETAEASSALLAKLDHVANHSAKAGMLLSKLERSGRDAITVFENRRRAWGGVASFVERMKFARQAAGKVLADQLRASLYVEYEQLGLTGRSQLKDEALRSHLAEQLFRTDLSVTSDRLGQAIVLLYLDRRLAAKPSALLAMYALAKRQHDIKRRTPQRHIALKAALTVALTTPIHLLGFDTLVAGFASYAGVDLVEWVAERLAGLARHHHARSADYFPAFGRFVEELQEHWAAAGSPKFLDSLLA